jgi:FkbH-like protein
MEQLNPVPVAISATFTAEPLRETLDFWNSELQLGWAIEFAPYNQVFQTLLDPSSLFWSNRSGYNVVLLRLEDWPHPEAEVEQLLGVLKGPAAALAGRMLLCVTPDSRECPNRESYRGLEARLRNSGVAFLSWHEIAELYPVREVHDPEANQLGHVPYTPDYFVALGSAIVRRLDAMQRAALKVIAVDCDDTLWEGICGEDGPTGVRVDPARRSLQQLLKTRQENGILLAIASKNNESDVEETFRLHPEMLLRWDDFTARQIHWEPKTRSLLSLSKELNLGLSSFAFIDDSPKECAEVSASLPEVLALPLPKDIEDAPDYLEHVWALDQWTVTDEDRKRSRMYAHEAHRSAVAKKARSLSEFLENLQLRVTVEPARADQLARVSQLTQRTNQMNTSGIRRSVGEIQELIASGWECLVVDASDRFGSYGLIGVALFRFNHESVWLDSFLMSCRALGRGIEHRLLRRVGELGASRGLQTVDVLFRSLPRNQPAFGFLSSAGGDEISIGGETAFRFGVEALQSLEYRPETITLPEDQDHTVATNAGTVAAIDYDRIARELRTITQIKNRMQAGRMPVVVTTQANELERRIAALWTEILAAPSIGLNDDFFNLGGHSLLAVQLLARVRKDLGVDVPLDIVYSGRFTVAELARYIEVQQLGDISPEEYAALLAELESMSDEEARALLAEEQGEHRY